MMPGLCREFVQKLYSKCVQKLYGDFVPQMMPDLWGFRACPSITQLAATRSTPWGILLINQTPSVPRKRTSNRYSTTSSCLPPNLNVYKTKKMYLTPGVSLPYSWRFSAILWGFAAISTATFACPLAFYPKPIVVFHVLHFKIGMAAG